MTTTVEQSALPLTEIVAPGVYDIPADLYHADPVPGGSLSSTGARKLLRPSCPALFKYERDHGQAPKRAFDLGSAAHLLVLGSGPSIVIVDAPDWRTADARRQRVEARGMGAIPLLEWEYEQVQAMAEALRAHPIARALFSPGNGRPEQSLFWQDRPSGVWLRARPDWLPTWTGSGRLIVPDYKTCVSAEPEALRKAVHNFGYHQQAAWYLDGIKALNLHGDTEPAFVFVAQEKTPPYLVTAFEVDVVALQIARRLNREAIDLYAECVRTGHWPAYSDAIELISLPPWVENAYSGSSA